MRYSGSLDGSIDSSVARGTGSMHTPPRTHSHTGWKMEKETGNSRKELKGLPYNPSKGIARQKNPSARRS